MALFICVTSPPPLLFIILLLIATLPPPLAFPIAPSEAVRSPSPSRLPQQIAISIQEVAPD